MSASNRSIPPVARVRLTWQTRSGRDGTFGILPARVASPFVWWAAAVMKPVRSPGGGRESNGSNVAKTVPSCHFPASRVQSRSRNEVATDRANFLGSFDESPGRECCDSRVQRGGDLAPRDRECVGAVIPGAGGDHRRRRRHG